jgi:hypothetical protein
MCGRKSIPPLNCVIKQSAMKTYRGTGCTVGVGRATDWKARILFSGRTIFSLLFPPHRFQVDSGAHPASSPMGTKISYPGGKAAGALS